MKKSRARLILGSGLVVLTIGVFVYYLSHHTYLLHQLVHTSPVIIILLLVLYGFWFGTLALTLQATIRICRQVKLPAQENLLLNAYSTLVNFFVPGQSGSIVRGVYLKKHHKLPLKNYALATLLAYGFYAACSAILLLVRSRPWWQTVLALIVVTGVSFLVIKLYERRKGINQAVLDLRPVSLMPLLIATVLQVVTQVAIYSVELHSVNTHISLAQSVTYTGAANFALFVALTPGAIGIRESFLLLSRRLHHISSTNIVAASLIDRSVFIVFLALLFVATLIFHAKDRLFS